MGVGYGKQVGPFRLMWQRGMFYGVGILLFGYSISFQIGLPQGRGE